MKKKTYHHGDLRHSLLVEARRVIEESGDGGLSLRACAREVGVDSAAAYRHFRKKDDVLAAVAAIGYAEMGGEMAASMSAVGRFVERAEDYFLSCCHAYAQFAMSHPHLYTSMFGGRCSAEAVEEQRAKSDLLGAFHPYERLGDALDLLVESSSLSSRTREGAELFVWSSVHGLVSLLIGGRGGVSTDDVNGVILRSCLLILSGLQSIDEMED